MAGHKYPPTSSDPADEAEQQPFLHRSEAAAAAAAIEDPNEADFERWIADDEKHMYQQEEEQDFNKFPSRTTTRRRWKVSAILGLALLLLGAALVAVFGGGSQKLSNISSAKSSSQASHATQASGQEPSAPEADDNMGHGNSDTSQDHDEQTRPDWNWDRLWNWWGDDDDTAEDGQEVHHLDHTTSAGDAVWVSSSAPLSMTSSTSAITTSSSDDDNDETPASTLQSRPRAPDLVPRPSPASEERFLSYNPHSGFHNQRIALSNAVLLANMLNRTLLLPRVRLGKAVGWKSKADLQAILERDQKDEVRVEACLGGREVWDGPLEDAPSECQSYNTFTETSWAFLVDLTKTGSKVPLVDRIDVSRAWFTSPDGLNLSQEDIMSIDDTTAYDYKIYATQEGLDEVDAPGTDGLDNYHYALPLSDLQTPEAESKRLIEFGSLYGSFRLNLKGADPHWSKLLNKIQKAMVFDLDLLENVSRQMAHAMGGHDNFIGLHLRVGDGSFKKTANKRMHLVLLGALQSLFRYGEAEARELEAWAIAQRRQKQTSVQSDSVHMRRRRFSASSSSSPIWAWPEEEEATDETHSDSMQPSDLLLVDSLSEGYRPTSTSRRRVVRRAAPTDTSTILSCPGPLHTEDSRRALNAHVYIATDARDPRNEPALASFFALFPCAHVLDDFKEPVPALNHLQSVYSEEERLAMFKYLVPFLEGMTAARGARVLGTSGSTFSRFVVTVLHSFYWPDREEQAASVEALWESLKNSIGL